MDILNLILTKIIIAATSVLMLLGIVDQPDEAIPSPDRNKPIIVKETPDNTEPIIIKPTEPETPIVTIPPEIEPLPTTDQTIITQTTPPEMEVIPEQPPVAVAEVDDTPAIPPILLNKLTRNGLVNIFCLTKTGGFFRPISGSGVFIDQRGVILTNAHVAQYFLLRDYSEPDFLDCQIRTGSPARIAYRAKLLYLSPDWVDANAAFITRQNLSATGEEDYALLRITESARNELPLPHTFPAITPFGAENSIVIDRGTSVLTAGYPAGFLGGISINKNLWVSSSLTTITNVFTFKTTGERTLDLIAVKGVIGAQEGSSGGAVVDARTGHLIGIIVTRTEGETTDERELRALTTTHIDESLRRQTGKGLFDFLQGDLAQKEKDFASTTAPQLREQLTTVLDRE